MAHNHIFNENENEKFLAESAESAEKRKRNENENENEHHHNHGCSCGHGHHEHESSCGCHHEHEEGESGKKLLLIIASALLLSVAVFIEKRFNLATWQLLLVYLVPFLLVGFDTLKEALEGIVEGEPFNENLLMSIATIGALCIGFMPGAETQFPEAVFVMLFFQVGELFEGYAEGKSRKSIAHLMEIRPDTATVLRDGNEKTVSPDDVAIGETIVIRPGEKVPIDAIIVEGATTLNTVALTGESMPREVAVGDEIISGCLNISGVIKARTIKAFGESTVSKILHLVEEAGEHKSKSETFITRFARIYTPIVVFAAIALAIIPPIISQFTIDSLQCSDFTRCSQPSAHNSQFTVWLYRALMFLVVSCPCALVISVPLTFFGGLGGASRNGILIKGANFMDVLAKVDTVVFDKTGTLTHGTFAVEAVHPEQCDEQRLLHLAAHVEHFSTHPIGAALRDAFPEADNDGCTVSDIEEIAGKGIGAKVGDDTVWVGNDKLMDSIGAQWHDCEMSGTIIHVAINGEYAGHIVINDQIKADSATAIRELKKQGVKRTVMLTGDKESEAANVAQKIGIDEYHAELLPQDKVEIIQNSKSIIQNSTIAFVGDGINDAPVLAMADVGIAMGGLGSDAAIAAADVVLMDDKPSKVATAIAIAHRTIRIARQNVIFAIGVKIVVLLLAAIGVATMWMAVFADVGVTVLAVFNAMRAMRCKRYEV